MPSDPILQAEKIVRDIHDKSGKHVQPVLKRYPLLFAFLIVFSVASILHGFELFTDQFEVFHTYPSLLILLGIIALLLTGMLYKSLDKME